MTKAEVQNTTLLLFSEPISGDLMQRTWRAEVIKGPDRGKVAEKTNGTIVIGTQPDCDLSLTDDSVSRRHVVLELLSEGVIVVDAGSTNGTRVGKARVERALVSSGGLVTVGRTQIRVTAHDKMVELEENTVDGFRAFVTVEKELIRTISRLRIVARAEVTILFQGEGGTGRRMLARLVHESSPRAKAPLIQLDCDSFPPHELEAHLFGVGGVQGALERAEGGTLVLAEVERLPLPVQAKLLQVIESRMAPVEVESNTMRPVDVRFMFTARDNLDELVRSSEFREDLYYRIAVVRARIPPLRMRPDDLKRIALYFAEVMGQGRVTLSEDALRVLVDYDWPANVRELASVVERAANLSSSGTITPDEILPESIVRPPPAFHEAKDAVILEFERRYVRTLIARHEGNVSHAAKDAGLSRGAFYALMRRSGIDY